MIPLIYRALAISILALGILLVKAILKNRMSAELHAAIWILLALRILLPIMPESAWSVMTLLPQAESQKTVVVLGEGQEDANKIQKSNAVISSEIMGESGMNRKTLTNLIHYGGAVVLFLYFLGSYALFLRRVSKLPSCDDATLKASVLYWCGRIGVRLPVAVKEWEGGAMLAGVLRPTILLCCTHRPQTYALIHELCHLKHKDTRMNFFAVLVLSLYWYNPLIWYCFFRWKQDMEVLCDMRVIRLTDEKQAYASALLDAATGTKKPVLAETMYGGQKDVERRIRFMATKRKQTKAQLIVMLLAMILLMVGCMTDAPKGKEKTMDGKAFCTALSDSVETDRKAGTIRFTIPEKKLTKGQHYDLQVSGRLAMGADWTTGMSYHAFEEESSANSWVPGKTYTMKVDFDFILELYLFCSVSDTKNKTLADLTVSIFSDGTVSSENE